MSRAQRGAQPRRYGDKLYVAMYLPEDEHTRLIRLADRKNLSINQTAHALLRIGFNHSELPEESTDGDADAAGAESAPENQEVGERDSRASGDRDGPEEEIIDFREQYNALDVREGEGIYKR